MPVAFWCVLAAAILPLLSVFPAKLDKSFDNARPRDPDYWRDGFRARAQGAQANGFEAFPCLRLPFSLASTRAATRTGSTGSPCFSCY